MPKKNKKSKEITSEEQSQLPAQENDSAMEVPAAAENASASEPNQEEASVASPQEANPSEGPSLEDSADDLLEDVRRSLIEDETAAAEKKSKWWKRIGRGKNKQESAPEKPNVVEEIDLPGSVETELVEETKAEETSDQYAGEIDELMDLLDNDEVIARTTVEAEEPQPEPEKPVDIEELKKQAFQPRVIGDTEETLSEVRSIALEGDEEVFVEVEAKPQNTFDERLKAFENALKPYSTYINIGIAILGVVVAVLALGILYNVYQRYRPVPVATQASNLPFPTSVSLPGGWTFQLATGTLKDGKWDPQGAEWLEGTEVCRWVALPWSPQLEAVVRTLKPDDPIELGMSNSDQLLYQVHSIRQLSPDEIQALDSNSPCLLIVLAKKGAEKSWVLTALP